MNDIASLDPNYDGTLLGRFGGERPPAAAWFEEAIAHEPERSFFEVDGAQIELLTWGEVGKPGLLFLHGNAAHADWWSFIAPQFAGDFRCAAISWSGMGRSGWRDRYAIPIFAKEVEAAIKTAELGASGRAPVIVAHSFGGFPTLHVASFHPEIISGAILVDSAPPKSEGGPPPRLAQGRAHNPRYPTIESALRRFRFLPEQDKGMPEIIDWMARGALHEVPETEDAPGGWTWRFDPQFWQHFERGDLGPSPKVPIGLIVGGKSALFPTGRLEELQAIVEDLRFTTVVAEAYHHVLVDHPLELIEAIREGLPKLA
ncbi:alpha/beta fold hydrolase [Tsuneonella dongtanensis]|uniref:alpha/beta fold hydrolase n=1 Tax=Tsuneonella dongtanensis TaxID=692370 RepID=UPI0018DAF752|nr:alpha/beta hydrolase [Tsuneonella dongtanensis]